MNLFSRLHARLGDLWWYTILLFAAQRVSDIINLYVGLWLVPRYVPQSELGAVLPLTQLVSFIGIPLAIVAVPFMKFLNVYAERGEMGKVKSLLRDTFVGTGVMALVTLLLAWFVLPFFFERLRVATGSLGFLLVFIAILSSVSNVFQNAVQGLKVFSVTVWVALLGAPLRLIIMLVAMPFRALSGYVLGQSATPVTVIAGALWSLRKKLGPFVKAEPYWREDGRRIWNYTWPLAVSTISTIVFLSVDQLVIRHRLSDFESAGFYIISRFADIAMYFGSAFVVFLFPLVASKTLKSKDSLKVLVQSVTGSFVGGLVTALLLLFMGRMILGLSTNWQPYQILVPEMFLLTISNTLAMTSNCLTTYEIAQGRFGFMWFFIPILTVKMALLYCLTGYGFFEGLVPQAWLEILIAFNPNRLSVVMWLFVIFQGMALLSLLMMFVRRRRIQ
ncbi:MAG: hypothetical protein MJ249_03900 [Kiritimatiellae bacterium]|nr:hypothetical protein [Kiritimatiellia bacterium]